MATGKLVCDEHDIHSAALCAWKEARGEGATGMLAVLNVLKNRVGFTGFASTLHDVIYGKNQFTSMSVAKDPQFNLEPKEDDESWSYSSKAAQEIFGAQKDISVADPSAVLAESEFSKDITNGAHFYANLHTMDKGGWFERNIVLSRTHHITAQIGKHTFFE